MKVIEIKITHLGEGLIDEAESRNDYIVKKLIEDNINSAFEEIKDFLGVDTTNFCYVSEVNILNKYYNYSFEASGKTLERCSKKKQACSGCKFIGDCAE